MHGRTPCYNPTYAERSAAWFKTHWPGPLTTAHTLRLFHLLCLTCTQQHQVSVHVPDVSIPLAGKHVTETDISTTRHNKPSEKVPLGHGWQPWPP